MTVTNHLHAMKVFACKSSKARRGKTGLLHTLLRVHIFTHAAVSQVKQHYLRWVAAPKRSNSDRQDGADVRRQARRTVHARSCQTNGDFALLSLARWAPSSLFPPSWISPSSASPLSLSTPPSHYPAPITQLFTQCDVTTSHNVPLFRASTPHADDLITARSWRAEWTLTRDPSLAWPHP